MPRFLFLLVACLVAVCGQAQQVLDDELEVPMQVLDDAGDLDEIIDEERRAAEAIPATVPPPAPGEFADAVDDEIDDDIDEGFEDDEPVEVEEKNAFSDLRDDFEHDDVDVNNEPDLVAEDDFEEDEEVDQVTLID